MAYLRFLAGFFVFLQTFFGDLSAAKPSKRLWIVGSTALYNFSTSAAERFGKLTPYNTPVIEANGTGGGFKIFCQSGPENGPDAVNASRAIEKNEREFCQSKGVIDLQAFIIGHDGLVIATRRNSIDMSLSLEQLFKAFSKIVQVNGKWIQNPYKSWSDIDSSFPNQKIKIMGPPPSSGAYASLIDLILKPLCPQNQPKCLLIRTDGAYIQASEHENVIVQKLIISPNKLAVFSFSFLKQHKEQLKALPINGNLPKIDSIMKKEYPLSRLLYMYATKKRLRENSQLRKFISSFYETKASGKKGYLSLKGLVSLTTDEKKQALKLLKKVE